MVDEEPHPEDSVNFLQSSKFCESDYSSGEDNMVALIQNDIAKIEPLNKPIKIGKISTILLRDSGSACSILNGSLAFWFHENTNPQLRTFSNELMRIEGQVQAPIWSNRLTTHSATFTVVSDGLKSLIGLDLFNQLGLTVFPYLISRMRRSKSHVAKSKFHKNFQPRHQKGRRIPINLQDKVNN